MRGLYGGKLGGVVGPPAWLVVYLHLIIDAVQPTSDAQVPQSPPTNPVVLCVRAHGAFMSVHKSVPRTLVVLFAVTRARLQPTHIPQSDLDNGHGLGRHRSISVQTPIGQT